MGDWANFDFSAASREYNLLAEHNLLKNRAIASLEEIRAAMQRGDLLSPSTPLVNTFGGNPCHEIDRVRDDLIKANPSLTGQLVVKGPKLYFVMPI